MIKLSDIALLICLSITGSINFTAITKKKITSIKEKIAFL